MADDVIVTCHHVLKQDHDYLTRPDQNASNMVDEETEKHKVTNLTPTGSDSDLEISIYRCDGSDMNRTGNATYSLSKWSLATSP